jgi:hypothetical protein
MQYGQERAKALGPPTNRRGLGVLRPVGKRRHCHQFEPQSWPPLLFRFFSKHPPPSTAQTVQNTPNGLALNWRDRKEESRDFAHDATRALQQCISTKKGLENKDGAEQREGITT